MNNKLSIIVGKRINALLLDKEKKQKELAAALGVTDNTISYFVSGKRIPNTEQIKSISEFFGVSADYILGLTPYPTNDKDLQFVCEYTKLSNSSIEHLHSDWGLNSSDIIDFFLADFNLIEFGELCNSLRQYKDSYNDLLNYQEVIINTNQDKISLLENYKKLKDDKDLKEFKVRKAFENIIQAYCRTENELQNKYKSDFEKKIQSLYDTFQYELFSIESGDTNGNNPQT